MARVKKTSEQKRAWLARRIRMQEGVKNGTRSWTDTDEAKLQEARFIYRIMFGE